MTAPKANKMMGKDFFAKTVGNNVCVTCHLDKLPIGSKLEKFDPELWRRSEHGTLSCGSCHDTHDNKKKFLLNTPEKLCFTCHKDFAKQQHMPITKGNCMLCHQPHGSKAPHMLVKDFNTLCQNCHLVDSKNIVASHKGYNMTGKKCMTCHDPHSSDKKGKIKKTKHPPFKSGKCETCHKPLSDPDPTQLKKDAKALCLSCHPAGKIMGENMKVHVPVQNGYCMGCHSPHASNSAKGLLKDSQKVVCLSCHEKVEKAVFSDVRHKGLLPGNECLACHKGHFSKNESLMDTDKIEICGKCHSKQIKHTHPIGPKAISPVDNKPLNCANSCHNPHGSDHEYILLDEQNSLCIRCHKVGM